MADDRDSGAAPQTPVPPPPGYAARRRTADPDSEREGSPLHPFERIIGSLRRMAGDYALLAVLDMRRAAHQLVWLVGAGIFIAVLVVTAWLAAVVALAVWLLGQGMSWPVVLAIAALFNLVGAGVVAWCIRNVFEPAPFSATLRQIRGEPAADKGAANTTGTEEGPAT